jgi:hypothetical protein
MKLQQTSIFMDSDFCFGEAVSECMGFFRKGYTTNLENHSKLVFFTLSTLQKLLSAF